jgi:site-specific DNA recombinase
MKREPVAGRKQVGIYLRVSTEEQAAGESPEHHEHRARQYAESKGWEVVRRYDLCGVSGKTVINHPEAQAMLRDVRERRIEALVFSKIARLARNTKELLEIADIFKECSADLVSLDEAIDTTTPGGRFFYTILAGAANWERDEIASRVAASVVTRAQLGKPLGGAAPFGYRWDDKKLMPDPVEAPVRRLIYDLFLETRRVKTVARLLNDRGYRTRDGSKFSHPTVKRLLEDPVAKGLRRANYTKSLGEGKKWKLKPEETWVWIPVPPIVSVETWEACNLLLAERKATKKPPTRRVTSIFAGYVFCGACGKKMYVPKDSTKYDCATCHRKIPGDDLEAVFHEQLRSFFFDEVAVSEYLKKGDDRYEEKRHLLERLEADRRGIASEMEKLYRLYLDDGITVESFRRRNGPLEERLGAIETEVITLQAEVDSLAIAKLSAGSIVAKGRDLYSQWPSFSHDEKRSIIEMVVDRIEIGEGEISIRFAYLPVPPTPPSPPRPLPERPQRVTQPQGFMAASSANLAGKSNRARVRTTVIVPSSRG